MAATPFFDVAPAIALRADQILRQEAVGLAKRSDRRFAWLTLLEWIAAILFAVWISPRAWSGEESQIHLHVWAAVFLGGIIAALPIAQALLRPGDVFTRHLVAGSQMLMAGLLVHLTGGRIETHFIFFGLLAFLAFYRDWRVIITATLVTGLDHLLRGIYWPLSIYGILSASPWRTAEHVGWVAFEVIFLMDFIRQSRREMAGVAQRHAQLEGINDRIAAEVQTRTSQLTAEIAERTQAEARLHLQDEVSVLLSSSELLEFIQAKTLRIIGDRLGWKWTAMWEVDSSKRELRLVDCWKKDGAELSEFELLSREAALKLGMDLPGKVWAAGDWAWLDVMKDSGLPRAEAAIRAGMAGAFAFPVLQGDEVVAVIEAFNDRIDRPEADLLEVFTAMGRSIGSFLFHRQAERALIESERRYRLMFDTNPQPMWVYDLETLRFLAVNEAALAKYGYSRAEFLSMTTPEIHVPMAEAQETNASPPETNQRVQHRVKDGRLIDVEIISNALDWENRPADLILANDITERERAQNEKAVMEVQLRQAQKLESIGHLAAGIAHEINTPTQYIGDNARFLKDAFEDFALLLQRHDDLMKLAQQQPLPSAAVAALAEEIRKTDTDYLLQEIPKAIQQSLEGVERVSTLVSAMKDFSHPGKKEKTLLDLNKSIESTITVARNEWKYVADLITNFDINLPPVLCMPGEFNQVILNLIVNAAHAISEATGDGSRGKGTITVSTHDCPGWVEIKIADTGTGIPEKAREHIFDPFFTTKEIGRGTGQGLAIARSVVVEKHGGTIEFATEIDQGTTFTIHLPHDGGTLLSRTVSP